MCQTTEAVDHEHGDTLQALRDRCTYLENMLDTLQQLCDFRGATICKLESQLEAVGAGGVGPNSLRIRSISIPIGPLVPGNQQA
jgi:DNA-binding transcriptional ArsR family regulator